ncbi:unnamed protein product, partial [Prorocentrum cordatum]
AGQMCPGKAAAPCGERAGECRARCNDVSLFMQGEGQQCGASGSGGHFCGSSRGLAAGLAEHLRGGG